LLFLFCARRIFFLEGKENFFAGFYSERAEGGGTDLYFLQEHGGIPFLPPCSCGDERDLYFALRNALQGNMLFPILYQ